jgi:hypothetical protein
MVWLSRKGSTSQKPFTMLWPPKLGSLGAPRSEAVTGPLVAAAIGLLYFLSLCFVDQGLAAFARGCPAKAQGVDVNDGLFRPARQGVSSPLA